MRSLGVVVFAPLFDHDLGLPEGIKYLPVEQLVAEAGIEALDIAVLPGRAWLDVSGFGADGSDPIPDGFGNELRAIVGPNVGWYAAQDEQVGQHIDHVDRVEFALHPDRQAFPAMLIDDVQRAKCPPIVGPMVHEVIRPDMVAILRSETDTRSVVEPEPALLRLFRWHFQPLTLPQTLDPLVIDCPPCISEQGCYPPVAVTSVLSRQFDHVSNQQVFVRPSSGHLALRRTLLAEHAACPALGNTKLVADQVNAHATTRGA